MELREPAHHVSPRAVGYWRLTSAIGTLVVWVVLAVAWALWPDRPGWATAIAVVVAVVALGHPVLMPPLRFRVHRWEVTPTAVHTRAGWVSREQRIAPLSRVQTVDSAQGALMRLFGLRSITVTTASAAGPLVIECLDEQVADRVVAELTAITGRSAGDAT
jgi:membrane protein YdbS with pleckstrin-like domain